MEGRMAAAKEMCCGCDQPCFVVQRKSCCPKGCKRCEIKKCKEKQECQCNDCNCGCKSAIKEGKQCKDSGCPLCIVVCKTVEQGGKCICSICTCGCENAFMQNKPCYEITRDKCKNCQIRCTKLKPGEDCMCYLCNCGCNGVNCQCCRWCNPDTTCGKNGDCNSEEIHGTNCPKGKCKQSPGSCSEVTCMCKEMGMVEREGLCECKCKCEKQCPRILCAKAKKDGTSRLCSKHSNGGCGCECKCNCNAFGKYYCKDHEAGGKGCNISECNIIFYGIGQCRFPCTNCGRLCDQDRCMIWIRVIVIGLIIVASLFVMRAIFPEKFHAIMAKIRASFPITSVHSGRSLNNLVGDRIPVEVGIDRYPAFRARTYTGLA
ncbi:hypothetical protein BBBOND_0308870 [Babesia bigemina]|uniref:Uncharacterized protein n=1 Tax=Babesia bigemina TaxID=5866 RepID=A0A061DCZ1_BABBI|nr:hypothetical protein BBBOND_0308870 [Babesia bigemina]CDR96984.1 hypothetical protein BBBOND_0308870 [Babesia bigemina]|eukprot:XP_012769170.1 hypothetical protein BBBOND_0308870 [Babesia bigemina]